MTKKIKLDFAMQPYTEQQEIIDCVRGAIRNPLGERYQFLVADFGRQSGKSWTSRYIALDSAANHDQNVMWVSPSISSARNHWNKLVKLLKKAGLTKIVKILQAAKEIHFPDGGIIAIRSAIEPDNLRGDSVDVLILDEAAFFRNGEYVWEQVCLPMITASRGVAVFTSTPNGRNWFYKLFLEGWKKPDAEYHKSWMLKSEQSPYQDKKLLAFLKKRTPSMKWRQEFEAEFLSDGGGVFVGVDRASRVKMLTAPDPKRVYVAGLDIGSTRDNSTFTVIDKESREQVFGDAFTNLGAVATIRRIIALLDHWQPEVTHVEKNGVGDFLFKLLCEVLAGGDIDELIRSMNTALEDEPSIEPIDDVIGGHRLIGVHVDNAIKRALVERAAADIEFGRLFLLAETEGDYAQLQNSEMSTFTRQPTASGQEITYKAAEGAHDDTVSCLYLAYKGVPKPRRGKTTWETEPKTNSLTNLFRGKGRNFHAKRRPLRTPDRRRT
jgi:phage terminase large subunit-like protein